VGDRDVDRSKSASFALLPHHGWLQRSARSCRHRLLCLLCAQTLPHGAQVGRSATPSSCCLCCHCSTTGVERYPLLCAPPAFDLAQSPLWILGAFGLGSSACFSLSVSHLLLRQQKAQTLAQRQCHLQESKTRNQRV